jgi:hypothetical protein
MFQMASIKTTPQLVNVGNLNVIVRASGNNNDDGNGWTKQVSDDRRPPAQIGKGIIALLLKRH